VKGDITKNDGAAQRRRHGREGDVEGDEPFRASGVVFRFLHLGHKGETSEQSASLGAWDFYRCGCFVFFGGGGGFEVGFGRAGAAGVVVV